MEEKIGPGWSGKVAPEVVEPLALAIERQFAGKSFSTLWHDNIEGSPFSHSKEPIPDTHRRIDEIKAVLATSDPYIWIIVHRNWNIHIGSFVCLTERSLLVETTFTGGYEVWCWMLEE